MRRKPDFVMPMQGERETLEIYGWPLPNPAPEAWVTCPDCGGEGSAEKAQPMHDDPYFAITIKCERCGGSGWECE